MNVHLRRLYSSRNNKPENFKEEFADWWKYGELEGEEIYIMVRQQKILLFGNALRSLVIVYVAVTLSKSNVAH